MKTKSPPKTYSITLNEKQCEIVMSALDMYFRVAMGQLGVIQYHVTPEKNHKIERNVVDGSINHLKSVLFGFDYPGLNYSICSNELPDQYRIAADIHDVIRHRLAVDNLEPGKKGFGVAYDDVWKKGQEPLPEIKLTTTTNEVKNAKKLAK